MLQTVHIPAGDQRNTEITFEKTGNKIFDQMVLFAERRKAYKKYYLERGKEKLDWESKASLKIHSNRFGNSV